MLTRHFTNLVAVLTASVVFAAISVVQAAPVTWGLPGNITGPGVINTNGTLVAAVNGDNGGNVLVDPGGVNITFTPDNTLMANNPFSSGNPLGGDAGFNTVINRADWSGTGANPQPVVIGGLTVGNDYEIQFFENDVRSCCNGRSQDIDDNMGNMVTLFMGNNNNTPLPGQFVIGSFTADAVSQQFNFTGTHPTAGNLRHPQLNAYVLRDVTQAVIPEPSTAVLATLAFLGLGLCSRNRRRRADLR